MAVTLGGIAVSVTSTYETTLVRLRLQKTVGVGFVDKCIYQDNICVAQAGAETLVFNGVGDSDFSAAIEITFQVWESVNAGSTQLISKSLTGGDITLGSDASFQLDLSATETGALAARVNYYEVWVTMTGDRPYAVGKGNFQVEDTRKYD